MDRKNLKTKNIFKSAAFGAALVLCGSFVPVGAIQTLAADYKQESNPTLSDGQIAQNTNRIEVDASGIETTVAKGGKFTIPAGLYYGGSTTAHPIGTASEEGITSKLLLAMPMALWFMILLSKKVDSNQVCNLMLIELGNMKLFIA